MRNPWKMEALEEYISMEVYKHAADSDKQCNPEEWGFLRMMCVRQIATRHSQVLHIFCASKE
jgi:hypothetical protein